MGQIRPIWNDGQAITTPDMQRPSDAVGAVDDIVIGQLYPTLAAPFKTIVPLNVETTSQQSELLVVPGATGKVSMQPAHLIVGDVVSGVDPTNVLLSLNQRTAISTPVFANNSSGSTRYDLVYVVIARTATVTGSRKTKSISDGTISTQTLTLADFPAPGGASNLLTIVQGVAQATPLASLPADTSTAWNFGLAMVAIPNGYAGTAIAQSTITPLWTRGWIGGQRVQSYRPASVLAAGLNESPALNAASLPKFSTRWGSFNRFYAVFRHLTTTTNFVLDNSIDWRRRMIWGLIARGANQGATPYPAPDLYTTGGDTIGDIIPPSFTGTAGTAVSIPLANAGLSGFNVTFSLSANGSGNLVLTAAAGNPFDSVNGDHYVMVIEASDQFISSPF